MARRKKIENETTEVATQRRIFESISNSANRSEKTSWNRKMNNMVKLIAKVKPIEEQILELIHTKTPTLDEIEDLRGTMVNECVHPYDHLVLNDDHVLCKFCNRKLSIPKIKE